MNRGNIPGFYWDAEKRKYFKIQETHKVPSNAKYSRSNITREKNQKREIKRRKVADEARMKDRIRPARILNQSPLLGSCGLLRELGKARPDRRDQALTEGLNRSEEVDCTRVGYRKKLDYQQTSELSVLAYAADYLQAGTRISSNLQEEFTYADGSLVSMETYDAGDRAMLFACFSKSASYWYHFFPLGQKYLRSRLDTRADQIQLPEFRHVWATRVNKETQYAAFTGSSRVGVHNLTQKQQIVFHDLEDTGDKFAQAESFAIDWISPSTLAFGFTQTRRSRTRHSVRLWDIRSSGTGGVAERLPRSKRVIAVESDKSGHNIIVASNLAIDLYDLRMARQDQAPLLSIPHRSSASRLDYALQPDSGLIAALDSYGNIPVYSLRNGELVRTLKLKEQTQLNREDGSLPRNLRWQESQRGAPMLTACAGLEVRSWTW